MEIISEGCRLCLDPSKRCFTTIDCPQMKDQMDKVFRFSIEPKPGYWSGVCQSCSHAISEFYQYSEKVRQNQELLNENVTNCDPTVDSIIILGRVKFEPLNNSDLPETREATWEPENGISRVSNFSDNELYVPRPNQSQEHPGKRKLDALEVDEPSSHDQEVLNGNETICDPTVDSKITLESVKVETLNNSGLPETTEDTGKVIFEASAEQVSTLDSEITLESVKAETPSDSMRLPETTEEVSNLESEITIESVKVEATGDDSMLSKTKVSRKAKAPYPASRKLRAISKAKQTRIRNEDDQLFNKYFSMICDMCGTSAETFTELSTHFRTEHDRRDPYVVCCNAKLIKRYAMRQHIKFHANPNLFRCAECGNNYKNKNSLTDHMVIKHPTPGQFKCDLCPQSFARELGLTHHMKRHVRVKCPKCGRIFASRDTLATHLLKLHSDANRMIVCDICGKELRGPYAFIRHFYEHKKIDTIQRIQCRICLSWLKDENSLRFHMTSLHADDDRDQQCDVMSLEISSSPSGV